MSNGTGGIVRAVEALLDGVPGRALSVRAIRISEGYRANRTSGEVIADATDAAIYALMRMPATSAAVDAMLDALAVRAPDFTPQTVLDAGAGPGTASLAVADRWPEAALRLCDAHQGFLALAKHLICEHAPDVATRAQFLQADLSRAGTGLPKADLVIASYAITEFDDTTYGRVADALWAATAGVLAIVEPGRPRDYSRLMTLRARLLAQGATVVAPCPHGLACPLTGEDWCHFSVRLPRSRSHLRLKGAALGYEDEKFSYLVLARTGIALAPPARRILAAPDAAKHEIRLKLCGADGRAEVTAFARRSQDFGRIRRARWGGILGEVEDRGQE